MNVRALLDAAGLTLTPEATDAHVAAGARRVVRAQELTETQRDALLEAVEKGPFEDPDLKEVDDMVGRGELVVAWQASRGFRIAATQEGCLIHAVLKLIRQHDRKGGGT